MWYNLRSKHIVPHLPLKVNHKERKMENKTFYKEPDFIIDPQELVKLAELSKKFGTINDMDIACKIAENIPDSKCICDYKWDYLSRLATVFNVGYILGKRAERKRRAKAARV